MPLAGKDVIGDAHYINVIQLMSGSEEQRDKHLAIKSGHIAVAKVCLYLRGSN